jgi:tetratricopeptide (TPR) repeat protein
LPDMQEIMESRTLKAKILYEMNRFNDSLNILNKIKQADPESIIKFPEVSLYLGYNYYQLGDNIRARKNLFRFYNSCPDREVSHLILTQIGDTYRNENLIEDAAKIYRMVLERYPKTDGAIISKIRLAEQQEKINWIEKTRKEVGSPTEIYENIVKDSIDTNEKNPLMQLSALKLAIAYQKDKNYQKSFNVLKELEKKYPGSSLKKEMRHALLVAMQGILQKEVEAKKHINVINFYLKEKKLFLTVNAPELYLPVARAFHNMNLEETATENFKRADPLLLDSEKPPDLLFFVGKHLFKVKQLNSALKRFDILINKHPSDQYVLEAYQLKGNILLEQKKYKLAEDAFSAAIKFPVTKCKRALLLLEKAKALTGSHSNEKALKAITEANKVKKDCEFPGYNICQEIGSLYLTLGYAKKAVTFFNRAIKTATEESDKISLKFKIAQCYLLLHRKEDSLALYKQILSLNDPFWSNLAQEKIKEIDFNSDKISEMLNPPQKSEKESSDDRKKDIAG